MKPLASIPVLSYTTEETLLASISDYFNKSNPTGAQLLNIIESKKDEVVCL
jgi:hypothetical protein